MLKKIFIIILISTNGISTIVAQNFGISLENTIWSGSMLNDNSSNNKNPNNKNSVILGVNYFYNLSKNLDVVGSVGYGFGFEIIPLKVNFNYKISDKISANLGVGNYMISDSIYTANSKGQLVEGTETRTEPSKSESGINFGMSYKLSSTIALTGNYNILKNGDADFNGISFGLSFTPFWGAKIKQQNQWMRVD